MLEVLLALDLLFFLLASIFCAFRLKKDEWLLVDLLNKELGLSQEGLIPHTVEVPVHAVGVSLGPEDSELVPFLKDERMLLGWTDPQHVELGLILVFFLQLYEHAYLVEDWLLC